MKSLHEGARICTNLRFRANPHETARCKGPASAATMATMKPSQKFDAPDPEDEFLGQSYVRGLIAKAAAYCAMRAGNFTSPGHIAQKRWGGTHPLLAERIKAGVAGGGTGEGEWGSELAQSDVNYEGDFVEYLHGITVFDRLPLRQVPSNVHIKGQDGAATGYWVGESKAIPVTSLSLNDVELRPLKVATIVVLSRELIEASRPSAERLVRDALGQAIAKRVDDTFLSTAAAVAGISPAGILNGVSGFGPSGADAAALRSDFQTLAAPFLAAKNGGGLVHVMTPGMALSLSLQVNALGQAEFADLDETGGRLFKRPVYTGDNVPAGHWLVLKPSDIWRIDDSGVEVSISDTATIEQDSAPTGASDTPTASSANLVSMWQTESVAFKVVRTANWAIRRAGAVSLLSNAEYGGVVS